MRSIPLHSSAPQSGPNHLRPHRGQISGVTARPRENEAVVQASLLVLCEGSVENRKQRHGCSSRSRFCLANVRPPNTATDMKLIAAEILPTETTQLTPVLPAPESSFEFPRA